MVVCQRVAFRSLASCCLLLFPEAGPLPSHGVRADEVNVTLKECPAAVQKTLRRESRGGRIVEVEKETGDGAQVVYEAEIIVDGHVFDVTVGENGRVIAREQETASEADDHDPVGETKNQQPGSDIHDGGKHGEEGKAEDKDDDDAESTVTMAQLPKAVRRTLKRESRGGEIEELEREQESGRVVFSAEVEYETASGEKLYEIEIAEDGTLLSKVLDDDEDDDEKDDDND